MFDIPGVSKHALFLQASLRENAEKFADVRICCSDGSVKQNRIFLGIVETYLQKLPEFCSPEVEVLVMFPEVSLEEYFEVLNEKLFNHTGIDSGKEDSDTYCDNVLNGLAADEFYANTDDYEVLPKSAFPENMENLEIIMHDDIVVSDRTDTTNKQEAVCEICSATVKLSALSQHLKSHEKRFKCDHCDKRFAREKAFLAHKSNYHNEAVKVDAGKKPLLTCSFCSIKFEAPVQLEKHLRSHTKSKPFQCSSCSKSFVSKSNLSAHQRIHDGTALRYSCDQCDKKFSHPSEVKQHMVVHTGIRAYTCAQCGNKYSRYPSLWKHMKKCNYTNKVVLVKPIEQDSNRPIEFFMKPLEGFMDNVKHEAVEVESVVVDEIIVTDDIGNEIMLPDDSFSLESAL